MKVSRSARAFRGIAVSASLDIVWSAGRATAALVRTAAANATAGDGPEDAGIVHRAVTAGAGVVRNVGADVLRRLRERSNR